VSATDETQATIFPMTHPSGYMFGGLVALLSLALLMERDPASVLLALPVAAVSLYVLLVTHNTAVVLEHDRVCRCDWRRRMTWCVRLADITRVVWTWRYGSSLWRRLDRARVELHTLRPGGPTDVEVIDYPGRWWHRQAWRLTGEIAERAGLQAAAPMPAEDAPTGDVVWERAGWEPSAARVAERTYRVCAGGREMALGLLVVVGILIGLTGAWAGWWASPKEPMTSPIFFAVMGLLIAWAMSRGLRPLLEEVNSRVRLAWDGLDLTDWLGRERVVPWEHIVGVRQVELAGQYPRGYLEVEVARDRGPATVRLASWLGAVPGETISLRTAIVRRLRLVQVEATEPGWWRHREEAVWRRPTAEEAPRP